MIRMTLKEALTEVRRVATTMIAFDDGDKQRGLRLQAGAELIERHFGSHDRLLDEVYLPLHLAEPDKLAFSAALSMAENIQKTRNFDAGAQHAAQP